ncbi:hypothetical protein H5410_016506 [Solanum commersonii]|uniref:Protein FAR1-RELATED SEQUENCE n=1 Tax=Solanum commersonii TaxID=4109 RepID=A0A9J5ZXJ6_SOLCO|nr:hypothetical protein H5410_016506 [Solanum commersonii]
MLFVPFTGVNNHHQSILFGCALLWDETQDTFSEYLSHVYHQYNDFSNKFSWCIHGTTTLEEFETVWIEITKMYNLEENSSTPMSVFVVQYDKVIDARYDKVREKDYKTTFLTYLENFVSYER